MSRKSENRLCRIPSAREQKSACYAINRHTECVENIFEFDHCIVKHEIPKYQFRADGHDWRPRDDYIIRPTTITTVYLTVAISPSVSSNSLSTSLAPAENQNQSSSAPPKI